MGWFFIVLSIISIVVLAYIVWNMMYVSKSYWPQFIWSIVMMVIATAMYVYQVVIYFAAGG